MGIEDLLNECVTKRDLSVRKLNGERGQGGGGRSQVSDDRGKDDRGWRGHEGKTSIYRQMTKMVERRRRKGKGKGLRGFLNVT